jgi:hypothetical protein
MAPEAMAAVSLLLYELVAEPAAVNHQVWMQACCRVPQATHSCQLQAVMSLVAACSKNCYLVYTVRKLYEACALMLECVVRTLITSAGGVATVVVTAMLASGQSVGGVELIVE